MTTTPCLAKGPRGFTLVEALSSLALSAVLLVSALGTYSAAQNTRADARREWEAFTVAQARMEILSAARVDDVVLDDTQPDTVPPDAIGSDADAQCDTGVDHGLSADLHVNDLGEPAANGKLTLCWKVTAGHPSGNLKNVRVVVGYPASGGGVKHVLLQTLR